MLVVYPQWLSVRTLRDTFTVKTDMALDEFSNAFIQLRDRFHEHMNIDSWKIARTMKEGVIQLVTNTDRLKEIGELWCQPYVNSKAHVLGTQLKTGNWATSPVPI